MVDRTEPDCASMDGISIAKLPSSAGGGRIPYLGAEEECLESHRSAQFGVGLQFQMATSAIL